MSAGNHAPLRKELVEQREDQREGCGTQYPAPSALVRVHRGAQPGATFRESAAAGTLHVDSSAVILVNFASTTRTFITRSSPTTRKEPRRKRAQVGCHLRKRVVNYPADHSFPPIKEGDEAQPCRQVFADRRKSLRIVRPPIVWHPQEPTREEWWANGRFRTNRAAKDYHRVFSSDHRQQLAPHSASARPSC